MTRSEKKAPTSWGKLTVSKNGKTVNLTFTDVDVQISAAWALKTRGYEILDDFFGYQIFHRVDDAIETAKAVCSDRDERS